jgi:methylmalonyl-CoA/ethylmalonyl-CoA epimerase
MSVKSLSHIAIAVRDLDSSLELFSRLLGVPAGEVTEVPSQGVKVAFLDVPNVRVEFIAPLDENSNLNKYLEKRGEGLHHISLHVDDLKETLDLMAADGVQLIDKEPRPGADDKSVAFLHPKSTLGVLIELEE